MSATRRSEGPRSWPGRVGSARLRHAPFALFVAGLLAYGAAFAWHLLDRFDLLNLIRDVNRDDSFYYFQIAYHLAGGEFSTFDGGITRTNGYHPLWLLLITPFYWFFDKTEALFAIKAFEIMLVAGGVALAAGAARVARLPWVLLFAALPALYGNPALFLGLEAAAGLFMLGLFLLAVCLFARDAARWRWPLAAVAFTLPWVRLEYAAVSVAAAAALCLAEWSGGFPSAPAGEASVEGLSPRAPRQPGGWRGWGRPALALNAAAPLSGAVAGILAYFAWNAVVFGGPVPVSAAAKRFLSQRYWERTGGYSLTENVDAFLRSGFFDDELLIALEVCVYAALVWWFSRRSRGRDDWLLLAFLVGVFGLAAGHLAKFAQGVLTVHPRWGEYSWYFVPAYLMEALVVPARCCVAIWFVRRFVGLRRGSRIPSLGIVGIGAVFLLSTADFTAPFRFVDSRRESTLLRSRITNYMGTMAMNRPSTAGRPSRRSIVSYMGTMAMNRLLPEGSVVGSWDSGIVGYFSRFPVMNLDGLANSWDYLRARRAGTGAAFLQRRGITHYANMRAPESQRPSMLLESPPYAGSGRRFKIWPPEWRRASWSRVDRSAWFWERMEPHLERQADGVGLLVDGRMAQAFVRDCTDARAEWTWTGQDEPVRTFWSKTSIGFCTGAVMLPHGALPPVRAASVGWTVSEYLADRPGERRPAIESDFDVYLTGNRLVYAKEPCAPEDVRARFFLHVDPIDPGDLPGPRRRHGFDNLDFRFYDHGSRFDGVCAAEVPLPEYGVAAIRTGQYVAVENGFHHIWEGEIRLETRPGADRRAAPEPEGNRR